MQAAFVDELIKISQAMCIEKLAISRGVKEALKLFRPEAKKAFSRNDVGREGLGGSERLAEKARKLLRQVGSAPGVAERRSRRAEDWSSQLPISEGKKISNLQIADQEALLKRLASGAHLPLPGEWVVPVLPSGEHVRGLGSKTLLFRGNDLPAGAAFVTRHPDVAAAYSLGRVAGQDAHPNAIVRVFRKKGVKHVGESPDMSQSLPRPLTRISLQERATLRKAVLRENSVRSYYAPSAGKIHPTYETVVLPNKLKTLTDNYLGSYTVRRTKTGDGLPAYALARKA